MARFSYVDAASRLDEDTIGLVSVLASRTRRAALGGVAFDPLLVASPTCFGGTAASARLQLGRPCGSSHGDRILQFAIMTRHTKMDKSWDEGAKN